MLVATVGGLGLLGRRLGCDEGARAKQRGDGGGAWLLSLFSPPLVLMCNFFVDLLLPMLYCSLEGMLFYIENFHFFSFFLCFSNYFPFIGFLF